MFSHSIPTSSCPFKGSSPFSSSFAVVAVVAEICASSKGYLDTICSLRWVHHRFSLQKEALFNDFLVLFMKDMVAHTWEHHPDYESLCKALQMLQSVTDFVNKDIITSSALNKVLQIQNSLGGETQVLAILIGFLSRRVHPLKPSARPSSYLSWWHHIGTG